MKNLAFLALAGLAMAPPAGRAMVLQLDPAHTSVEFTLGDVLHTVHGTFKLKRGNIDFDPATGKIGGEVVVDAASGDSGSTARDRRMNQKILESARYSDIVFAPDRVEGTVSAGGTLPTRIPSGAGEAPKP